VGEASLILTAFHEQDDGQGHLSRCSHSMLADPCGRTVSRVSTHRTR